MFTVLLYDLFHFLMFYVTYLYHAFRIEPVDENAPIFSVISCRSLSIYSIECPICIDKSLDELY